MFDAIAVLLFVGVYKLSHHFYSIVNCVHAQIIWHCTEEEFATYGPLFIMQIMKDYDEVSIVQASDATFVPTPSICVDNWNSPCQPPTHTNTFVAINLHLIANTFVAINGTLVSISQPLFQNQCSPALVCICIGVG